MSVHVVIERLDGGPRLVIHDAYDLAFEFFALDASSIGSSSFDAYAGTGAPDRITNADISAINMTMRARSRQSDWSQWTSSKEPFALLAELGLKEALFQIPKGRWNAEFWAEHLAGAIESLIGPYRSLSRVTKVLHAKRPGLFPVLDSLVVDQLGGRGRDPQALMEHVRSVGLANRAAIRAIRDALRRNGIERTEVRILDALLWASHPGSSLAFTPGRFERQMLRIVHEL